ncbi:hypothetical protein [Aquimarina sp. 2201CG5-10]|uniref:hypothetical protein n=1 Tax=Aquimarina callyspongiae TaxID=3098150 RepID=UPI002AB54EC0|nr:hypothetical protein [Aquimarina sp. 2201CG5-10]MDY8135674.1 hypothetical protein [Aquimarina sp. 2201CG5-10]
MRIFVGLLLGCVSFISFGQEANSCESAWKKVQQSIGSLTQENTESKKIFSFTLSGTQPSSMMDYYLDQCKPDLDQLSTSITKNIYTNPYSYSPSFYSYNSEIIQNIRNGFIVAQGGIVNTVYTDPTTTDIVFDYRGLKVKH